MGWNWRKEYLDLVLVPTGLLIMFGYHLFLLHRCLKLPHTTVIGFENHSKRAWIERTMQLDAKERGLQLSVINNNMSAATSLSSISLALASLIGALLGSSSNHIFRNSLIYGDTSPFTISLKYMAILSCFLVAFASFVQTTRCYVQANFLITMPNAEIPVSYVEKAVIQAGNFWSIGMRALYLATTLLLWIFGPIPMLVSTVIIVAALYNLDTNSTPLHQFQRPPSRDLFQKIDHGSTTITRAMEHHERPHENRSRTTGAHNDQNPKPQ